MTENKVKLENTEIMTRNGGGRENHPNLILCLLSKVQQLFNFPPPQKRNGVTEGDAAVLEQPAKVEQTEAKTAVVKVPRAQPEMPSLKLESEESEQNTNPIVLWQVYAIGGFFILKWVLARLKERGAKKGSSDEDPSPTDD